VFNFGSTGTDTRFKPSRLEVLDPGDFFSSIYEH
jgi:hypothetical protein